MIIVENVIHTINETIHNNNDGDNNNSTNNESFYFYIKGDGELHELFHRHAGAKGGADKKGLRTILRVIYKAGKKDK